MGMQINTNVSALNAYRNLSSTQNDLSKSLEKLSSGLRINRAADDAAGLAISEGLRAQVGGLNVAARNAQDGISVIQTAEGALTEVHSILQRVRDLAVQAGNDSNNTESRAAITKEAGQLLDELTRISDSTNFNGINLLDGSKSGLSFQVGANGDNASQISVNLTSANVKTLAADLKNGTLAATGTRFDFDDTTSGAIDGMGSFSFTAGTGTAVEKTVTVDLSTKTITNGDELVAALNADANFSQSFTATVVKDANGVATGYTVRANDGATVDAATSTSDNVTTITAGAPVTGGLDFSSAGAAKLSIQKLDGAITDISAARADLGAIQNRFESTINSLNVSAENLSAAESRIRDTDMAAEMVKFTAKNILSQAGTAMLAQANQANQGVLQLLR
ncbi:MULTISPECIES: flagellin [unclassified Microbacterium]|uniref:flagellin N-terminal helical domain-containing protein n=1 Tax=unclassified Microbacterium TaxID=2609290 RepID=UPI0008FC909D|nr:MULTISPECIES: flagellin [unclassified Microbacterium]OIU85848.1 flagellin [Microbacterium sp. AR7-10]